MEGDGQDFLTILILVLVLVSPPVRRWLRRFALRYVPLKRVWKESLEIHVPLYRRLPKKFKRRLEVATNVFLREVRFRGKNGFKISDTEKVLIAGHACVLVLGKRRCFFNGVKEVQVYPSSIEAQKDRELRKTATGLPRILAGLWTATGVIRLSWDSVSYGTQLPFDGRNVVFHEFAHELDYRYGYSGAMGEKSKSYRAFFVRWLFDRELRKLKRGEETRDSVIDYYGTTSKEELFACATEAFFERPADLKEKHWPIYKRLQKVYRLDPASW